ncbi:MAG: LacI family DNA-binding transcriptional regulator [Planctomycetota bacterium]
MKPTLRDVALAAEVSVSTASRALNGHPALPAKTIAAVRETAARLRYQPRRVRRHLDPRGALAKANIGVITLGMARSLITLPTVASAISGAEAALSEAGASVQLAHVPELGDPPDGLLRGRLDGVVLTGALEGELLRRVRCPLFDRLPQVPTVWLLGRPPGFWGDTVAADDWGIGIMAAERLAAAGHRYVAFVNPKPAHLIFNRREDGFVAAARRLGLRVDSYCEAPPVPWHLPLPAPEGVEIVQELVDRLVATEPRPTAIFAAADSIAPLVYRALAVRGLRVGDDISLISANYDATVIAGLHPALETFDVHAFDVGRMAVQQLATRLLRAGPMPECELLLRASAVAGASVRDLSAAEAPASDSPRQRASRRRS